MSNITPLEIQVTLTFTEESIADILNVGNRLNHTSVTVDDLKRQPELLKQFTDELLATDFLTEIVEGSYDAMANDWMCNFFDSLTSDDDE